MRATWGRTKLDDWVEEKPSRNWYLLAACLVIGLVLKASDDVNWGVGLWSGLSHILMVVVLGMAIVGACLFTSYRLAGAVLTRAAANGHSSGAVLAYYAVFFISLFGFLYGAKFLISLIGGMK